MLKSYNFPSVYEATNQELANVAENILDGLKTTISMIRITSSVTWHWSKAILHIRVSMQPRQTKSINY